MNLFEQILEDHKYQRKLLSELATTSGDSEKRRELFSKLKTEAKAHANAEEQTLYAKLFKNPEVQEQARHSVTEHEVTDSLIDELEALDAGSGGWLAKFEVLKHKLEHHLEEEESHIFPKAKEELGAADLEAMSAEFAKRKNREVKTH